MEKVIKSLKEEMEKPRYRRYDALYLAQGFMEAYKGFYGNKNYLAPEKYWSSWSWLRWIQKREGRQMNSKWKVTSNSISGQTMYGVYRTIDMSAVDHSGNREYAGGFTFDREAAEFVVAKLNEEEELNGKA